MLGIKDGHGQVILISGHFANLFVRFFCEIFTSCITYNSQGNALTFKFFKFVPLSTNDENFSLRFLACEKISKFLLSENWH